MLIYGKITRESYKATVECWKVMSESSGMSDTVTISIEEVVEDLLKEIGKMKNGTSISTMELMKEYFKDGGLYLFNPRNVNDLLISRSRKEHILLDNSLNYGIESKHPYEDEFIVLNQKKYMSDEVFIDLCTKYDSLFADLEKSDEKFEKKKEEIIKQWKKDKIIFKKDPSAQKKEKKALKVQDINIEPVPEKLRDRGILSIHKGKNYCRYVSNYVVFDLETTGLSTDTDRVIEISGIKVGDSQVLKEFSSLVNPGIGISDDASNVNGITDEMVADAPDFKTVLTDFLDFTGDLPLVGHNIRRFDLKFLYRDAQRFWGKTIGNDYTDTLDIARLYLPELKSYTLSDLAHHYDISAEGAHRALNDCRMNQQVYEHMKEAIEHPSEAAKSVKKCPLCGNVLRLRNGKFGEFYGCTGYPYCTYTRNK